MPHLCRYCCKSPKLPGANFPAVKKSDRRPLIRVPSIALPRSSASLSLGDEVPHIFTRKSRLRPGKFFDHQCKKTFATISAHLRHSGMVMQQDRYRGKADVGWRTLFSIVNEPRHARKRD